MAKTLQFHVKGTNCASCEIVIERELRKFPGVQSVEASHVSGLVKVTAADDATVSASDLTAKLGDHGYTFEHAAVPLDGVAWSRLGGAVALVAVLYVLAQQTGILTFSPEVSDAAGLGAIFVIGLIAAFSSCTAVVGGLIAAFSARHAERHAQASFTTKMAPHIVFNLGRIAGFAAFGALIGLLGQAIALSPQANGVLVVVIATLMIGLGIQLMDVLPPSIAIRPPKWLAHRIHALSESDKPWVPSVLGALTFFLPCGFTQSVQLFAMTTGSPSAGALTMLVFALGTAPALLGIGAVTSSTKGASLKRMTRFVGAFVIVLGISNVSNGATLMGFTGFSNPPVVAATQQPSLVEGKQLVQMEVSRWGYSPDVIEVVEDVPVRWEIYGEEVLGCASTLVVPQLGLSTNIRKGLNVLEFIPKKPGQYVYSCSMGMYSGTLIVLAQPEE